MNRQAKAALAALALALPLVLSAQASARTLWVCDVPNGDGTFTTVTFVSAADAAHHGIDTANGKAGTTFHLRFGEICSVESG
jgi:hypothetical protein